MLHTYYQLVTYLIFNDVVINLFKQFITNPFSIEQIGANHSNGTEVDEPMDVEAGQFEDAEEDP